MNDAVKIDTREVDALLGKLSKAANEEAVFACVREVSNKTKTETQKTLLSRVPAASSARTTGKPMYEGVRNKHHREYLESVVHILGEHRLKWFEAGTADRWTGKRNVYDKITGEFTGLRRTIHKRRTGKKNVVRYTGRMWARNFFADTRKSLDVEDIMKAAITKKLEELTGETL